MKISYDSRTDALDVIVGEGGVSTRDAGDGLLVEYDGEGRLTRVQIEQITARAASKELFRQIVIDGIGPFAANEPLIILPRLFENSERPQGNL